MGKDNLDQQQPSEPIQIKPELVDFLYIDSERVDSFISQIKMEPCEVLAKQMLLCRVLLLIRV